MVADLGVVKNFSSRGFGFVRSCLDGKEIFFHIKSVEDRSLRAELDANWSGAAARPLRYEIGTTSKGSAAVSLTQELATAPELWRQSFIERAISVLQHAPDRPMTEDLRRITECVLRFRADLGSRFQQLLLCDVIQKSPHEIARHLNDSDLDTFRRLVDVKSFWEDDDVPVQDWLIDLTARLYGEKGWKRLADARTGRDFQRRAKKEEAERARAAEEKARAEAQRRQQEQELRELFKRFAANPRGIRDEWRLKRVCISCGSSEVDSLMVRFGPNHGCRKCGEKWYANHCWSCVAQVDSRDPETPKCASCGWQKCAKCGACSANGCHTNPYSRDHRYKDDMAGIF
jgi:cold shock CspA family protein